MSAREIPILNALFACAMTENCSLAAAADLIKAPRSVLEDAVRLRCSIATGGLGGRGRWPASYEESIYEAFRRLEETN